jgi:Uma2 family endonuclease
MTPNNQLLLEANKTGIRLEIQNGLPLWEAAPLWEHQEQIDRIRRSIIRIPEECACGHISDVYIAFPNGRKRPDTAIFCQEPTPEQKHTFLTLIPCAVIEVVSRGYELKDIELGPPFYLAHGVQHNYCSHSFASPPYFCPFSLAYWHHRANPMGRKTPDSLGMASRGAVERRV